MKTRMHRFMLIAACLVGPLHASPLHMTLSLEPAETLPGIPVTFRVSVTNTGSAAATLPQWVVLEVTPENGEPFLTVAGMPRSLQRAAAFYQGDRVIPPGESRTFDFWAGPESPPWWAGPFWLEPATYSLRLVADEGLEKQEADVLTLREPHLIDPVVSNAAVLTIVTPTGVDAEVWTLAKAADNWDWHSMISDEVWEKYPDSEYAAYIVPREKNRGDVNERARLVDPLLERNPRGSFPDWWRLLDAQGHHKKMLRLMRTDPEAAFRESEVMRLHLEAILARDTDPGVKQAAEEIILRDVLTLAELQDLKRRIDGGLPVVPRLQCAKETGNRLEAVFGYNNPNPFAVNISIGPRNGFAPEPYDRGQPTKFEPGSHESVVSIVIDGKKKDPTRTIAWTLDGVTVSAPSETAPKCKGK